jgi:hypothetical protein
MSVIFGCCLPVASITARTAAVDERDDLMSAIRYAHMTLAVSPA